MDSDKTTHVKIFYIKLSSEGSVCICAPLVWCQQPANPGKTKEDFYVVKCCKAANSAFLWKILFHAFLEKTAILQVNRFDITNFMESIFNCSCQIEH